MSLSMSDANAFGPGQFKFEANIYDSFMKRHLSHYGYYTGRNKAYRPRLTLEEWNDSDGYQSQSDAKAAANNEDNDLEKLRTTQLVLNIESGRLVPRLKEPRHLYRTIDGTSTHAVQQRARWPDELEIVQESVKHIPYVSAVTEGFYVPNGLEKAPEIKGTENGGQLVYELKAKPGFFFHRSQTLGCKEEFTRAAALLQGPNDRTLVFESRFESGNLEKAIKVDEYEYELWLRKDLYTNKHTQWFYFKISNVTAGVSYRFTICNFTKSSSLYSDGMQPVMYSQTDASSSRIGWRRSGSDIKYYRTTLRYFDGRTERNYYALTFTIRFPHSNDSVYLAHCYPYTYTDLQDYLGTIASDENRSKLCKLRVLCRSLAGNLVYLLTITSPNAEGNSDTQKAKKAVVVTARVHPGESNSSWMMKGLIDYLLGTSDKAVSLREKFIFKVVPMLNPDGVIVGNYRCSLTGRDLNRNYLSLLKDSFPSIWHTKAMTQRLQEERQVILYCDMHGHSKKQNVFIYGCENIADLKTRFHERIFPAMLSKQARNLFKLEDCHFTVQKSKEGTGRVAIWNMGIANSYTLEATFCGSTVGTKKNCQFTTEDFESIGHHFCETLFDYSEADRTEFLGILSEIREMLKKRLLAGYGRQAAAAGAAFSSESVSAAQSSGSGGPVADDSTEVDDRLLLAASPAIDESSDSGSDSSESDGLPVNIEFMQKLMSSKQSRKKRKKEKTRNLKIKKNIETSRKPSEANAHPIGLEQFSSPQRDASQEVRASQRHPRPRRGSRARINSGAECVLPAPCRALDSRTLLDEACDALGSVSFRLPRTSEDTRHVSRIEKTCAELKNGYLQNFDDVYLTEGLLSSQHLRSERDCMTTEIGECLGQACDPENNDKQPAMPGEGSYEQVTALREERNRERVPWLPARPGRRASLTKSCSAGSSSHQVIVEGANPKRGQCVKQYPLPFDQSLDATRVSSYSVILGPVSRSSSTDAGISSAGQSPNFPATSDSNATGRMQAGLKLLAAYAGAGSMYGLAAKCNSDSQARGGGAEWVESGSTGTSIPLDSYQQRCPASETGESSQAAGTTAAESEKMSKQRTYMKESLQLSFSPTSTPLLQQGQSPEEPWGQGHRCARGSRHSSLPDVLDTPKALKQLLR